MGPMWVLDVGDRTVKQEPKKDPLKAALEAMRQIDSDDDVARRVLVEYVLGHVEVTREEVERDFACKRAYKALRRFEKGEDDLHAEALQRTPNTVIIDLTDEIQVCFQSQERTILRVSVDNVPLYRPLSWGLGSYQARGWRWDQVWPEPKQVRGVEVIDRRPSSSSRIEWSTAAALERCFDTPQQEAYVRLDPPLPRLERTSEWRNGLLIDQSSLVPPMVGDVARAHQLVSEAAIGLEESARRVGAEIRSSLPARPVLHDDGTSSWMLIPSPREEGEDSDE